MEIFKRLQEFPFVSPLYLLTLLSVCILFLDFRIKHILAYLRVVDIMSPQNAGILYLMAFQIFIIFFRLAGNFLQRYWIFEWEFAYKEGEGIFVKVS